MKAGPAALLGALGGGVVVGTAVYFITKNKYTTPATTATLTIPGSNSTTPVPTTTPATTSA